MPDGTPCNRRLSSLVLNAWHSGQSGWRLLEWLVPPRHSAKRWSISNSAGSSCLHNTHLYWKKYAIWSRSSSETRSLCIFLGTQIIVQQRLRDDSDAALTGSRARRSYSAVWESNATVPMQFGWLRRYSSTMSFCGCMMMWGLCAMGRHRLRPT